MTNDEFLAFLFALRPSGSKIFTASFPGDPKTGDFRFNPFLPPGNNNYFCISSMSSTERRTPQYCVGLHALVVDDVGQKLNKKRVEGVLGVPTWIVETSEGSFQWGYRLNPPVTDQAVAEGLVRALSRVFSADMAGRNRLARLPVGTNGKTGKNGFVSIFHGLSPSVSLTERQAIERLEAVPVAAEELIPKPFLPPDRDPVLAALPSYESTRTPGTYRITCPWVDEHTGGRDDGTVYIAPAGFRCWHGHCSNRTFADLRRHLGLSADEIDDVIVEAELTGGAENRGVNSPPPAAPIAQVPETKTESTHPWANASVRDLYHDDWTPLSREEVARKFPRKWLFRNVVPLGVPWGIAGEGGLGKSRLGLALCMSIASGLPFGEFVPAEEEGARAVFLTQEDTLPDRNHRYQSQLEFMAEHDPRWHDPEISQRLGRNLYIPTLPYGQTLTKAFEVQTQAFWDEFGEARLVIYDPLILFWDHSDTENGVNSAKGAVFTIKRMIDVARHKRSPDWSVGALHHLSRQGNVYGSVMIEAHFRTLFGLTLISPGNLNLEVLKVNASNIKGHQWGYKMEPVTGALYPTEAFEVSPAMRLSRALHSGLIKWDQTPSNLVREAVTTNLFGTDPERVVKTILNDWKSSLPESLGLTRLPYGRYQPIEGFNWEG